MSNDDLDKKMLRIGQMIKQIRVDGYGLSLVAFSEIGKVSPRSLSYYEKGTIVPDLRFFQNLAEQNIRPDINYLVYGIVNPSYLTAKEMNVIKYFRDNGGIDEFIAEKEVDSNNKLPPFNYSHLDEVAE